MPGLGDILDVIGGALEKPGRAVRGALGGRPRELFNVVPFSDTLGLTDPHERVTGRALLDRAGVTTRGDRGWGSWGLGLAADLATDPLSYLPVHSVARALRLGRAGEAVAHLPGTPALRRAAPAGYELAGEEAAQAARRRFRPPAAPGIEPPAGGARARYPMKPGPAPRARPFEALPHEVEPGMEEPLEAWQRRMEAQAGIRRPAVPEAPEEPLEAWQRRVEREQGLRGGEGPPPPPPSGEAPTYTPPPGLAPSMEDPAQLMFLRDFAAAARELPGLAQAPLAAAGPAPAGGGLLARLRAGLSRAFRPPSEELAQMLEMPPEGTAAIGRLPDLLPPPASGAVEGGPGLSTALRALREGIPTVKGIGTPRERMLAYEGADVPALARFARRVEGSNVGGLSMPPWAGEGAGAAYIRDPRAAREELLHALTQRAAHGGTVGDLPPLARPAAHLYRAAGATGSDTLTGLAQVLDELSAKAMAGRGAPAKLSEALRFLFSPAAHAAYGPHFGRFGVLPRAAYHGVPLAIEAAPALAAATLGPGEEA